MYDLDCTLVEPRPFMVLDGLSSLYGLKYNSVTIYRLSLYLCFNKLIGSVTGVPRPAIPSFHPRPPAGRSTPAIVAWIRGDHCRRQPGTGTLDALADGLPAVACPYYVAVPGRVCRRRPWLPRTAREHQLGPSETSCR